VSIQQIGTATDASETLGRSHTEGRRHRAPVRWGGLVDDADAKRELWAASHALERYQVTCSY
jgi:hypothetical protein